MNYFEIGSRQDYSGYWPDQLGGEVGDARIPAHSRKKELILSEYLGDPPSKPRKHGSFHKSAYSYFVRDDVMKLFEVSAHGNLLTSSTTILGREAEVFHQVWVTNFVDCLDLEKTVASPSSDKSSGKLGVIKRPAFDERRWDGSGLFVVPQDPSYCLFCSADFAENWKASKKKGIVFRRFLMDPEPIRC